MQEEVVRGKTAPRWRGAALDPGTAAPASPEEAPMGGPSEDVVSDSVGTPPTRTGRIMHGPGAAPGGYSPPLDAINVPDSPVETVAADDITPFPRRATT